MKKYIENTLIEDNTRISWVDIAKSIGIIAIVLGHSSTGYMYNVCFSFNSVIFFVLSGMTFCRIKGRYDDKLCFDNRSWMMFIKNILQTIFVPYIICGVCSIFIYSLIGNIVTSRLNLEQEHFSFFYNFIGLIYGNSESGYFEWNRPLWFLTALIMVEIICFCMLKLAYRDNGRMQMNILWISMAISVIWIIVQDFLEINFVLPFELETAFGMYFFFCIGLLIRSIEWDNSKLGIWFAKQIYKKLYIVVVLNVGIVTSGILTWINGSTDTRADKFSNVYLYLLNALIACAMVILLARCMYSNKMLEYIGKRTMAILVMHKFPIMFFKMIFPTVNTAILEGNVFVSIIMCAVTIALCLVVEKVINMFLPEVFGKTRKMSGSR